MNAFGRRALALAVVSLAIPEGVSPGADPVAQAYLSHPPIRRMLEPGNRPLGPGPTWFTDPRTGSDANDGSRERPWRTINHALTRLKAGDTLCLRGGTYFENVYCAAAGAPDAPITIRSAPGERVTIDGGIAAFQTEPAAAWQPDPAGTAGEYVSTGAYRNLRDVVGLFADSNIGLQTYWDPADLRSSNELWVPDPKTMVRPVYCGPGLWYDKQTGRIHARLAHTHIKPSEDSNYPDMNYSGETDPRRLPLVVASFNSTPLFVDQAMHVRFQDLEIRGGGYRTVRLNFGVDIAIENCVIYGGTYCVWSKGTGPLRMKDCGVHGMIPPWGFRDENCLYVYSPHKYPPFIPDETGNRHIARLPTHAILVSAGGFEFEVFYYPHDHNWDISNCEFSDGHDGIYLAGHNIRFHHNWLDAVQDDGIYISSPTPWHTHSVRIYQNYVTSGICAFGQHGRGGPGGNIYIYRNVVDLRKPVQWGRPTEKRPEATFMLGHSALFMHGSDRRLSEEAIHFYHNTFLLKSLYYAAGTAGYMLPEAPRRVFNNLFLYAQDPKTERGLGLAKTETLDLQMDGNAYWNIAAGKDSAEALLQAIRKLPLSDAGRKGCPQGLEANSIVADPRCASVTWDRNAVNDYRLQPDSPARGKGVALPADYADPLRPPDGARPDIGALPAACEALCVGVRGRVLVGALRPQEQAPTPPPAGPQPTEARQ